MDEVQQNKIRYDTQSHKAKQCYSESYTKNGDETKKFYECKIDECGKEINGTKLYSLVSHIKYVHTKYYNLIKGTEKEAILIKRLRLLHNAVEIVSVNGLPFSFLLASGYQAGIENKVRKIRQAGYSINITTRSLSDVKEHLHAMAEKVRAKIRNEVKNEKLSALLDIVTLNGRSILGLSIQFTIKGELKIRSIGMIELVESHTAKYLGQVTKKRFDEYDIGLRQIISISKDNGANVGRMVRDIDDELRSSVVEKNFQSKSTQIQETAATEIDCIDDDILHFLTENDELTDEHHLQNLFGGVVLESHSNTLNEISKEIENYGFDIQWHIEEINCAAHTVQLAIHDALSVISVKHHNVIHLCRRIVKFLRLPKSLQQMNEAKIKYKRPRLEVATRWCSLYLMVFEISK